MIREEVGSIHPILGVRILRYLRHNHLTLLAIDDGQLHLNEYLGKVRLVPLPRMEQGCGGLPTIDDLEVDNPRDRQTGIRHPCLDTLCSGRDPVVVGKEHPRLVQDRCPDSLVHITAGLQECADVLLKQTCSESLVQGRQHLGRHDHEIGLIGIGPQVCGKAGDALAEHLLEVEVEWLLVAAGASLTMKS